MDLSVTGRIGPRLRRGWSEGAVEQLHILPRRSWKLVAVAAGLLLIKDTQFARHVFGRRGWFDDVMIALWVVILVIWFVAAVGEFLGTEVVSVTRGELILSRGIGPLRRTFRYSVSGIAGLASDGPVNAGQAKPRLQHIYRKPDLSAVRFEFRGSTVYFGEWLDEAEGQQVVRWLKSRLPSVATQPLPYEAGGTANMKL